MGLIIAIGMCFTCNKHAPHPKSRFRCLVPPHHEPVAQWESHTSCSVIVNKGGLVLHKIIARVGAKKPPVGFEPTTSRLLSGCSAS